MRAYDIIIMLLRSSASIILKYDSSILESVLAVPKLPTKNVPENAKYIKEEKHTWSRCQILIIDRY